MRNLVNAVSTHTAGWRTKNRYVNICIYVDSLRLLAATPPTGVVVNWDRTELRCCVFWGLGLNPGR